MPFSLYSDDIVISGISAKLPDSDNMEIFAQKLLSGQDIVTSESPRWTPGFFGLPERNGRIANLNKFDAQFFGVHVKQAQSMDPQMRMLLELTHEAIVDAGIESVLYFLIRRLKSGRTPWNKNWSLYWDFRKRFRNVFSGHPDFINGYVSLGHHRSMIANRISFTFDLNGPSFPVDTACSSSMVALDAAVNSIRLGKCDAAIVGGSNLVLHPYVSLYSHKIGMFSADGKCKSFDISGDGYVRSEGIAVILIQKKPDARREYLTIVNIRSNTDGYKANGLTFPSGQAQKLLLEETYFEVGVDPTSIEYFEAHRTGTKAGDPEELNSLAEVFCSNRSQGSPLLIGAVKSNVGHLEPVAGLASIAKMIVASQTGIIPANLHFNVPNPDIPALIDGRLKVVTENTKWGRDMFGLNSFGWGGANVHAILKPGVRVELEAQPGSTVQVPFIVPFSGRTPDALTFALEKLTTISHQKEVVALIHQIHKLNIPGHPFRGFALLNGDTFQSPVQIEEVPLGKTRPTFYIFSGMGSQYCVAQLMVIDTFRKSIEKSAAILAPLGYDLLSNVNSNSFDTVTDSFINITTTQVALVDTLRSLGVEPEGILGHSVGEVCCGYADYCLTHEETVELAYWRCVALTAAKNDCTVGSMAAVGQCWDSIAARCPFDIYPACHNTKDSVTISGPQESIRTFVKALQADKIFAKEIPTNGFAFHSKHVRSAGIEFQRILTQGPLPGLLANPKKRSSKWISTSVLDSEDQVGKTCCADYYVNNLLSPVHFAVALDQVPKDAIVIEIAPHALLQSLLRRGLSTSCTNIGLTKRDAPNHLIHFLESLGKIYLQGSSINFSKLYKPAIFPVPVDTPMIAPLVQWDHSYSWDVGSFTKPHRITGEGFVDVSLSTDEYSFLADHVIDGRNICPVTLYLYATWRIFAALNESCPEKFPVMFESVKFHRPILLSKASSLRLFVQILNNSGNFEMEESNTLLASGRIVKFENKLEEFPAEKFAQAFGTNQLKPLDIYKELKLRGYEYQTRFRGILSQSMEAGGFKIKWTNHWVSFLDSMMQSIILSKTSRDLDLPASITRLVIDPIQVQRLFQDLEIQKDGFPTLIESSTASVYCPGINLHGLGTKRVTRKPLSQRAPMFNNSTFIPYNNTEVVTALNGITALIDIILDNSDKLAVEFVEFVNNPDDALVNYFKEIDPFRVEYMIKKTIYKSKDWDDNCWIEKRRDEGVITIESENFLDEIRAISASGTPDVVVVHSVDLIQSAQALISNRGFLLAMTQTGLAGSSVQDDLKIIATQKFNKTTVYLLRKLRNSEPKVPKIVIPISTLTYDWFDMLKESISKAAVDPAIKILLTAQPQEYDTGIVGLVKCLRKEPGGSSVRYIYSQYENFSDVEVDSALMSLDLVHNVINAQGIHGFFVHHKMDPIKSKPATEFYLDMVTEGDPQSFNWIQASPYTSTMSANCLVQTHFATVNLIELIEASHQILQGPLKDDQRKFAIEFSGIDNNRRRVIGISDNCTLSTTMEMAHDAFLVEIPSNLSLEEGVTLPVAYFTAIYALQFRGHLKESESVFVTNGSTPLGQAAVHLANSMHCFIWIAYSNDKEREFLKLTFPFIPDENILCIESTFASILQTKTVDLVLNLEGPALKQFPLTLANGARFLDFTNHNESPNTGTNISVHKIDPKELLQQNHPLSAQVSQKFKALLDAGALKPLPSICYNKENVQDALKGISKEEVGTRKTIIKLREENDNSISAPTLAMPRIYFDPSKVYILIGGLGEMGIEIVLWMIARGGRKFILGNRSGVTNSYQRYHCSNWKKTGAEVLCPKIDVTNYEAVCQVFKMAVTELGSIGGIFNLSMILRDSFIESMSREDFEDVVKPKVLGTINLDKASRIYCLGNELEYFCVFSSVTSARGNAGQTNYGFGNSMAERLIEKRIAEGLPGLAIQFGPIGDLGYVENEMRGSSEDKVIVGMHPQRISALDKLLQNPTGIKTSVVIAQRKSKAGSSGKLSLLESLALILGVSDTKKMNLNYNLGQLGMDSLMTVEIKQMMEEKFGIFISIQELRNSTVSQLLTKKTK